MPFSTASTNHPPASGLSEKWTALCLLATLLISTAALSITPAIAESDGDFAITHETLVYQRLPEIENRLYGHAYPDQGTSQRVARIERTLFGESSRGSLATRLQRVDAKVNETSTQQSLTGQEPMIAYLEEKLFQRTYTGKPLPDRLQQLETQVFGRSFDSYPVPLRIKKLTYAMPLMTKGVRLTKGDVVIASAGITSPSAAARVSPQKEVLLSALNSPSKPINEKPPTLSYGDYFHAIHRNTNGTVIRWSNLPIHVYAKPSNGTENVTSQAIKAWQQYFSVETVNTPSKADVIVSWDRDDWEISPTSVLTRPVVRQDENKNIRTVIMITMYPARGNNSGNMLHALSHQLGHAFGLWGHSDNPADLMYPAFKGENADFPARWSWRSATAENRRPVLPAAETNVPTQRDINTLIKVYDQPATDLSAYSPY